MGQSVSVGDSLFNEGKLPSALVQYTQDYASASSLADKSKYALQIGVLHQLENNFDDANNFFNQSLAHMPSNGLALLHMSILYFIKSTREQCDKFAKYVDTNVTVSSVSKASQIHAGIAMCILAITAFYHNIERSNKRVERYLSLATDFLEFSNPYLALTKLVLGLNTQDPEKELQLLTKASNQIPNTSYYKVWEERGKSLLLNHFFGQSLGCFNICMAISPLTHEAVLNAALLLFDSGEKLNALRLFEYYTEVLDTKCANAWMHRGHICMELRNFIEAAHCYAKFVEYDPTNAYAWERQAMALLKLKGPNYATEALQCASNATHLSTLNIKGLTLKGYCLIKLEMYDDAIKLFDSILERKRNEPEALRLKAKVCKLLHRYDEALELYERVLEKVYDDKKTWCNYAECLLYVERFDEGIEATEHALLHDDVQPIGSLLDKEPARIPFIWEFILQKTYTRKGEPTPPPAKKESIAFRAWLIRSMLLWKSHSYEEALSSINQTISIDNQSSNAWDIKGHILSNFENKGDESLLCFKKASELDPKNPLILQGLLSLYCILKKYDLALEESKKLLDLIPDDPSTTKTYASILSSLQRHKEVIKFLKSKPGIENDITCLKLLVQSLRMTGDFQGELDIYNKMLLNDMTNSKVLLKRGRCYMLMNDLDKAIEDFKQSIASCSSTNAKGFLALCFIKSGENRENGFKLLKRLQEKEKRNFTRWCSKLNTKEMEIVDDAFRIDDASSNSSS